MYEDRLYEVLKEEMLQEITQTDKREGSFVNDIISTSAMKGEEVWAELSKAVGVAHNAYWNRVQSEVVADDLFCE